VISILVKDYIVVMPSLCVNEIHLDRDKMLMNKLLIEVRTSSSRTHIDNISSIHAHSRSIHTHSNNSSPRHTHSSLSHTHSSSSHKNSSSSHTHYNEINISTMMLIIKGTIWKQ